MVVFEKRFNVLFIDNLIRLNVLYRVCFVKLCFGFFNGDIVIKLVVSVVLFDILCVVIFVSNYEVLF